MSVRQFTQFIAFCCLSQLASLLLHTNYRYMMTNSKFLLTILFPDTIFTKMCELIELQKNTKSTPKNTRSLPILFSLSCSRYILFSRLYAHRQLIKKRKNTIRISKLLSVFLTNFFHSLFPLLFFSLLFFFALIPFQT